MFVLRLDGMPVHPVPCSIPAGPHLHVEECPGLECKAGMLMSTDRKLRSPQAPESTGLALCVANKYPFGAACPA